MRPLVINDAARAEFTRVKEFAEKNRISLATIVRMASKAEPPPGDDPRRVVELPHGGWRIVFTIEEQPMGWVRHLSISTTGRHKGKCPNLRAVALIAQEFGFSIGKDLEFTNRQKVFKDPELGWIAPNVVEPLHHENLERKLKTDA